MGWPDRQPRERARSTQASCPKNQKGASKSSPHNQFQFSCSNQFFLFDFQAIVHMESVGDRAAVERVLPKPFVS
jgi:hypothetical protein